jgi:hypothetical protein
MSEPSAFDAAWRVVKGDDAFDVVPYSSLKPSTPYSRTDRMAQPSDPYMVHDDGRMPERKKKDPKAQMKHIERARRKVNEDPTE